MNYACIIAIAFLSSPGCEGGSELYDQEAVQAQQAVYQIAQPLPHFDHSRERAVAIQLYEARNNNIATFTVWRSDTGIIEGHCPSVGYPLPYDTSLTNPLQSIYRNGGAVVGQAEPNGLFASQNSISTWVLCTHTHGNRTVTAPIYIESRVTAYPFPVEVDYENNRIVVVDAAPSVTIDED